MRPHRRQPWLTLLSEKAMAPTPVLLPGKSHGRRSLVGCSPWGREESDTTERLPVHVSLSCSGEGNGSPLRCSCQENPRDGGAWWAAIYGVAQSQTRLKRLSSSNITMPSTRWVLLNPYSSVQFSSVQSLSCVRLFVTSGTHTVGVSCDTSLLLFLCESEKFYDLSLLET